MAQVINNKPFSYAEAIRTFERPDVQQDLNDACGKLAHAMSTMMDKFEAITKQMHTIDLLRRSTPLKPKWDSMRQVSLLLSLCTASSRLERPLTDYACRTSPNSFGNFGRILELFPDA